ncbi:MAG: hypothetical protein ABH867_00355 [Patescibacteria group bacterium]|nr:hypothetical protein [Patescibacteria group bacterium]
MEQFLGKIRVGYSFARKALGPKWVEIRDDGQGMIKVIVGGGLLGLGRKVITGNQGWKGPLYIRAGREMRERGGLPLRAKRR